MAPVKRSLALQLLRFVTVGLLNTSVGLSIIFALTYLGLHPLAANFLGYLAGLTLSFFVNRSWTFGYEGGILSPSIKFLLGYVFCYLINLAVLYLFYSELGFNIYVSQGIAVISYSVAFFLICRLFVFSVPQRTTS